MQQRRNCPIAVSGSAPGTALFSIRGEDDRRQVQEHLNERDRRHGPRRFSGEPPTLWPPLSGVDVEGQAVDLPRHRNRLREFLRWLIP